MPFMTSLAFRIGDKSYIGDRQMIILICLTSKTLIGLFEENKYLLELPGCILEGEGGGYVSGNLVATPLPSTYNFEKENVYQIASKGCKIQFSIFKHEIGRNLLPPLNKKINIISRQVRFPSVVMKIVRRVSFTSSLP